MTILILKIGTKKKKRKKNFKKKRIKKKNEFVFGTFAEILSQKYMLYKANTHRLTLKKQLGFFLPIVTLV